MSTETARIKGPTIMLASGNYFDLSDPESSAILRGASELLARLLKMRGQKAAPEVIAWLQHELQPRRPVQGDLFA